MLFRLFLSIFIYLSLAVSAQAKIVDPILDYRFDECSYTGLGGDVIDQIGYANGKSNGIPDPIDDSKINKSLDLRVDGTSDWVHVPRRAVNGLNEFSVSVWFKTLVDKDQQEIVHALGHNDDDDELEIYLKDSQEVYIKVRDKGTTLNSGVELTDGKWHHLVVHRKNKQVCLFIDGTARQCANGNKHGVNIGALSVTHANAVVIGQEQDSFGGSFNEDQEFEGLLDEFKIFGVKLSADEIFNIYNRERSGNNFDGSVRAPLQCDNSCGSTPGKLNAVGIKIGGGGSNRQINNTTEALAIHATWLTAGSPTSGFIGNSTYVAASGSSNVDRIDFGGSGHDFSGTLPYPGVGGGVNGSDFLVHTSGTLSLPAGDYTIFVEADDGFSFMMDTLSGDAVSFNKFGSSIGGESNELRFERPTANSNTGGSFTLSEDSIFDITAIFFERGGGDYLEISIANDIRSNYAPFGYEILRDGALNGKVKFGLCTVSSKINHYQIIHDGQGLTCEAEMVRVKACTNADVETCVLSDEPLVPLSVKAIGSRSITVPVSSTGLGTGKAYIPYTIKDSTLLSLSGTSLLTVCDGGSPDLCNMVFADTGFQFTSNINSNGIPTQLSGKPSNEGYNSSILSLQAIKTNPVSGVCEAALTDPAKIEIVAECIDPIECKGQQVIINGASISTLDDSDSPSTYSPVSLDFGDSSDNTAEFTFKYHDAGKVQLHARYNIPVDDVPSGDYMKGSSNEFVVRPFGFYIDATDNPTADSAAGDKYKKAGEIFKVSVTAVQWQAGDDLDNDGFPDDGRDLIDNAATPNFGKENPQERIVLTHDLIAPNPNGGSDGVLSGKNIVAFSNGKGEGNFTWSEVGIISITANLVSQPYLGAENVTGSIPHVGRFIPDHFQQTIKATSGNTLGDEGYLTVKHNDFSGCKIVDWAYTGQMTDNEGSIRYEVAPQLTISAHNSAGDPTENYKGDFAKLLKIKTETDNEISFDAPITTHANGLGLTGLFKGVGEMTDLGNGVLTYQLSDQDRFSYNRNINPDPKVAPFQAAFELPFKEFKDSDGVTLKSSQSGTDYFETPKFYDASGFTNTVEIRFGRLVLKNSFGPNTLPLAQPMEAQYFDGNYFVTNTDDDCTSYTKGNYQPFNSLGSNSLTGDPGELIAGETQEIKLTAPNENGEIELIYGADDWLKFDWDNDGSYDDDPTAIATFGLFRGNDQVIYRRRLN